MSVFTMIRRGRQAAKEHSAKQAEQKQKEEQKTPYKHIPRHAAIDALSGGPAGWRAEDRPRILEQNRRRSAMTASGLGMSGVMTPVHAGMMPRVNSSLSHVSYPTVYANPVVQVPRSYSYTAIHPGWSDRNGEVLYSHIEPNVSSFKGKEVERPAEHARGSRPASITKGSRDTSPKGKSEAPSPVGSSGNSTSSQDDLEMKPSKRVSYAQPAQPQPQPVNPARPAGEIDYFHRLAPGRSRRVSDPHSPGSATSPSQRYPGAAQRSSMGPKLSPGVPPVPTLPPMQFGGSGLSTPTVHSSAASSASLEMSSATSAGSVTLSPNSYFSPPYSSAKIAEPSAAEEATEASMVSEPSAVPVGMAVSTPPLSHKNRRISKTARFTELDASNDMPIAEEVGEPPIPAKSQRRMSGAAMGLPVEFDESALRPAQVVVVPEPARTQKAGKLSKNPQPKLVKKNRWSIRSSKPTAVAV